MFKPIIVGSVLLALAAPAGMRVARGQDHIDPKGAYPNAGTGNVEPSNMGWLHVTFPHDRLSGGGDRQFWDNRRSRYRVYDDQGRQVREIVDLSGTGHPGEASLPPGRYLVKIDSPNANTIQNIFWVSVESNKVTAVDANTLPPAHVGLPASEESVPGAARGQ